MKNVKKTIKASYQNKTICAKGSLKRSIRVNGELELEVKKTKGKGVKDRQLKWTVEDSSVLAFEDMEDALYLSRMAKTVYLVHRRDTFRANAALQEAVQKTENIVLVTNAVPTEITGEKRVETLKLLHGGSPEELSLDGVFVAIGSVPNTSLLEGVAELDSSGYVQAGEDGRTSVEGLFAAGDVRTKALRQVITAAADGANCVASAEKYLLENRG